MKTPKIFIITDLEGVGGIMNFADWCVSSAPRNEEACRLLCEEVNAVARGCFDGGFATVIVDDGHGSGGSLRIESLDRRLYVQRGSATGMAFATHTYDALAFVGQHAKAGARRAQLAHTQTQEAVDFRVNGVSIGEYGQHVLCAEEAGIPVIFASGDKALTEEAQAFSPRVATVAVKEGLRDAPTDLATPPERVFAPQCAVLSYPRKQTLEQLYDTMKAAAVTFLGDRSGYLDEKHGLSAPYVAQAEYRSGRSQRGEPLFLPARRITTRPHDTVAGALDEFYGELEWSMPDGIRSVTLLQSLAESGREDDQWENDQ